MTLRRDLDSLVGELASGLIEPALHAGRLQLAQRSAGAAVMQKADRSPVTAADRDSEAVLTAALGVLAPGLPIVAEEAMAGGSCPIAPGYAGPFFLIDPLDGTREYVDGGSDFTINVALIVDGQPLFGLVFAPALSLLFVTTAPNRAVSAPLEAGNERASLADLKSAVLATRPLPPHGARTVMVSRRDRAGEAEANLLAHLGMGQRIAIGSSLKFCDVARGAADVYPRLTSVNEWDIAAGHAVLVAAGGGVHDLDGNTVRYGQRLPSLRTPPFIAAGVRRPIYPAAASGR
jgi:3'(2'), 5'-bisphosphate nucleotidase